MIIKYQLDIVVTLESQLNHLIIGIQMSKKVINMKVVNIQLKKQDLHMKVN